MSALVIKNLPEALHRRLKARAVRNHRSLTKETIALLEASVDAPEARVAKEDDPDPLQALFEAGDRMTQRGVDFEKWAKHSRDVWR